MTIQQKIEQLREELNQHTHNYYVLDNATISDFDFDTTLKELEKLEEANPEFFDSNSPTQRVGGEITKNFTTVTHQNRMYSLSNSYSSILIFKNSNVSLVFCSIPFGVSRYTYSTLFGL